MRRWLARVLLVVGVVLLVGGLGLFFQWKIEEVECRADGQSCPAEVVSSLQALKKKSFWLSDVEAQTSQLLSAHPEFELVRTERQLPRRLTIELKPQQPVYQLARSDQQLAIVNQDGVGVLVTQALDLPRVQVSAELWQQLEITKKVDPIIHAPLSKLFQACASEKIECQRLELISPELVLIELPDSTFAVLDLQFSERDLKKLSLVLKGLEPDKLKDIQEIDVRYRLPVLRPSRTVPRHDSQ